MLMDVDSYPRFSEVENSRILSYTPSYPHYPQSFSPLIQKTTFSPILEKLCTDVINRQKTMNFLLFPLDKRKLAQ